MAPPRWIHCNLCYYVMLQRERKFYHLSCRHVLCRPCMAKTDRGKMCPVCKHPLHRFTELNNQMDRKEKMYYEPGALKALGNACQSVDFQYKQRENLIRGILRCKKLLPQMKEMENVLRQRIVATQRQYEKCRTYRRNLQDILRQTSPGCGASLITRTAVPVQPLVALSNRESERDSSSQRLAPALTETFGMVTPFTRGTGDVPVRFERTSANERDSRSQWLPPSFTETSSIVPPSLRSTSEASARTARNNVLPQTNNNTSRYGKPTSGGGFANDSGISEMQTPAVSLISRPTGPHGRQRPTSTPVVPARAHPSYRNQLPSTITRR